jgi:hypothetical protein
MGGGIKIASGACGDTDATHGLTTIFEVLATEAEYGRETRGTIGLDKNMDSESLGGCLRRQREGGLIDDNM